MDVEIEENVPEPGHLVLEVFQQIHEYGVQDDDAATNRTQLQADILSGIRKFNMATVYADVCARYGWDVDAALQQQLNDKVEEESRKYDEAIDKAREKFGDVEVYEATRDKAEFLAKAGDKGAALATFDKLDTKHMSTGQKIDVAMSKARLVHLAHGDWKAAREAIQTAKAANERGGDWDRRNRLKVYEALQLLAGQRDFQAASPFLMDAIATFTATELISYSRFIFYAVLVGLKTLDRPTLKKRLVDSPDVLAAIGDTPGLADLLNSFYEGRYRDFLQALVTVYPLVLRDRYLGRHAAFYLREMRLAAYAQFLEAYKSVTLSGMAARFGVSPAFLDSELPRFIASGRISARIDAVSGVIETVRPDTKNAQYLAVIKQGDALLNKVQKLSRVVAV